MEFRSTEKTSIPHNLSILKATPNGTIRLRGYDLWWIERRNSAVQANFLEKYSKSKSLHRSMVFPNGPQEELSNKHWNRTDHPAKPTMKQWKHCSIPFTIHIIQLEQCRRLVLNPWKILKLVQTYS